MGRTAIATRQNESAYRLAKENVARIVRDHYILVAGQSKGLRVREIEPGRFSYSLMSPPLLIDT